MRVVSGVWCEDVSHEPRGSACLTWVRIAHLSARLTGYRRHRGQTMSLIDSTATYACCIMQGRAVPTINLRVDYLRPAGGEEMMATAIVRRAGRTVSVVDVDVIAGGKLVAIGRADLATPAQENN
ncbi:PaaI family thioesterase [Sphingosinicella microcystinivorans]|uniref:PaaI family thioesterase n=1 Tax=Sphingosinicella microcystinivorans TaxID=335406 RepID=UPI000EB1D07B|nr:PaaI family thioesterase [Sphingosinicella microcystinivorans]